MLSDFFQTSDFYWYENDYFQNFFGDDRMKTAEVICEKPSKNEIFTDF